MYASAVGKMWSEVDRAYLAGLIDGDGCIMATIERHREKKFGFRIRVEVKVTQKESNLLSRLSRKYKCGSVRANRTTFDWIVRDTLHVEMLLHLIQPYTQSKKTQVVYALRILHARIETKKQLVLTAQLADALSKCNVRSKDRRKNFATMIQDHVSSND